MSELKTFLSQQLHEAQNKYVYFHLAVAASAIALAVQKTAGSPLAWSQLPLGLAVLSWAASFFSGCRNRSFFASTIYANLSMVSVQDGSHPDTPQHPELAKAACEGIRKAADSNIASMSFWGKAQSRLLVLGAVFFLIWHVMDMAATPPPSSPNAPATAAHSSP